MNYLTQTSNNPLFPDLLWSKPENKALAGKLLIIGGNSFGFADVAKAYDTAIKTGVGEVKVLLPDIVQKIAGGVFEHALFAPTNPSGSFAKTALPVWIDAAKWADAVLLPGDMSRNAETAGVIDQFLNSYEERIVATKDAAELLIKHSGSLAERQNTTLVLTMADLQHLAKLLQFSEPLTFESPIELFASRLQQLLADKPLNVIVKRHDIACALAQQKLSYTTGFTLDTWRVETASKASVWWLQNPEKPFEALTTAMIC